MLEDDGKVHLAAVSVEDGSLSRPIAGHRRVEATVVGPDGAVVALVSEPRLPAELFVLDPSDSSELRRLSHVNDELLKSIWLADAEEQRFPTLDGTEIQAFIVKPRSFDPKLEYPTMLWLHGGQESQYDYGFYFRVQLFAANGYVVVMPNVRGSGGRGIDFTPASTGGLWHKRCRRCARRHRLRHRTWAMSIPTGSASAAGRTAGRLRTT